MDRERFKNRSRELGLLATQLAKLSAIPERATTNDFRDAADLIRKAADDLDELLKAPLPGCTCRRVQDYDRDYLEYDETCQHHRALCLLHKRVTADYLKMERALKDEVRLRLVAAALSGSAALPSEDSPDDDDIAKRAIAIADEAICRITRETKES